MAVLILILNLIDEFRDTLQNHLLSASIRLVLSLNSVNASAKAWELRKCTLSIAKRMQGGMMNSFFHRPGIFVSVNKARHMF